MSQLKTKLKDKQFRWFTASTVSVVAATVFALYNGWLGLFNHVIWSGSICLYYIFLACIRVVIILDVKHGGELSLDKHDCSQLSSKRKAIYVILSLLIVFSALTLAAPIALMVLNQKSVDFGLIPALTVATYTTYKVTMAIVNFTRYKKTQSVALKLMGTINFIDAVLSVLTLQNTLITVQEGGVFGKMIVLATVSCSTGMLIIFAVSVFTLVDVLRQIHNRQSS